MTLSEMRDELQQQTETFALRVLSTDDPKEKARLISCAENRAAYATALTKMLKEGSKL